MNAQTIVRTLSVIVSIPLAVMLAVNLAGHYQFNGWGGLLTAWLEMNLPKMFSLATEPWMKLLAMCALSFTFGVWADYLLRRHDRMIRAREKKLYHLGLSLLSLAEYAEQLSKVISISQREQGKFYSSADAVLIPLHNLDFAIPDVTADRNPHAGLGIIEKYSRGVGKLLVGSNFSEAQDMALQCVNDHANAPGRSKRYD